MSLQDSHQISDIKIMLTKGIDGKGISSIEKTGSQGLVDIYTITFTDGTKTTFTVTNGVSGGMSSLFIITSEEGATITVTSPTGRNLDVVPVSGSSTQWQCESTEYGEHTIVSTVGGSPATGTVDVDVCKIYEVSILHFNASITATFPEGTSCVCQGGGASSFSSSSPHTFDVHSADTYTLTVSYGGVDYTTSVTITTDGQSESVFCPEVADAPTDDINLWLMYGGVSGSYSTLNDILADSTALATLMASTDAVDYLVRCTTWASSVCADSSAMSYIGLNNYASNTLLADSTWCNAICNSTYFESVLNVKVPTMTSNTTPSGEVITGSNYTGYDGYRAFDGNNTTQWLSANAVTSTNVGTDYIIYDFQRQVTICKVYAYNNPNETNDRFQKIKMYGSDNVMSFTDVLGEKDNINAQTCVFSFANSLKQRYCKAEISTFRGNGTTGGNYLEPDVFTLQFYGREDV